MVTYLKCFGTTVTHITSTHTSLSRISHMAPHNCTEAGKLSFCVPRRERRTRCEWALLISTALKTFKEYFPIIFHKIPSSSYGTNTLLALPWSLRLSSSTQSQDKSLVSIMEALQMIKSVALYFSTRTWGQLLYLVNNSARKPGFLAVWISWIYIQVQTYTQSNIAIKTLFTLIPLSHKFEQLLWWTGTDCQSAIQSKCLVGKSI